MKVSVMGHGVVGSGVVEVLMTNGKTIADRYGFDEVEICHILDLREFPDLPYSRKFTKDFNDILSDESTVVVETMGGVHPAYEFVKQCLEGGKSVCTSNKALVAAYGDELLEIAQRKNINFLFEASVGGGIPILRPISKCLSANEFSKVAGILNGTTNFILTKMIEEGLSLDEALKIAREKGYAEKDPTDDIEGNDAARKVCILSALCFGSHVYPEDVKTQGITGISLSDVEYAKSCGRVIKLVGSAEKDEKGRICTQVSPALIDKNSTMASVNDVFNVVMVEGNAVDRVYFVGKGAGKLATASAVVADVIDCAVNKDTVKNYKWKKRNGEKLISPMDVKTGLYVRGFAGDREEAVKIIKSTFASAEFLSRQYAPDDEIAFITNEEIRSVLEDKLKSVTDFDIQSVIRLADY